MRRKRTLAGRALDVAREVARKAGPYVRAAADATADVLLDAVERKHPEVVTALAVAAAERKAKQGKRRHRYQPAEEATH